MPALLVDPTEIIPLAPATQEQLSVAHDSVGRSSVILTSSVSPEDPAGVPGTGDLAAPGLVLPTDLFMPSDGAAARDSAGSTGAETARAPHEGTDSSTTTVEITEPTAEPTVTVSPGDSLWRLAASHLPDDASANQIAQAWHAWYEVNKESIGPDPDQLRPGQILVLPAGHVAA